MKSLRIEIKGLYAHFRKSETNNNPLTHDFITKTALIGLIGAVLGIEREKMKDLFPQLSDDLKYNVQVVNNLIKESWGFTFRSADYATSISETWTKTPKQMEFIKNPVNHVTIGLFNERSESIFNEFLHFCQKGYAKYEPVLGLHNCPAEINFLENGNLEFIENGDFTTYGFAVKAKPNLNTLNFNYGFDKIPTFQNNDFWNLPDKYQQVIYPSNENTIIGIGEHYVFNSKTLWCMI